MSSITINGITYSEQYRKCGKEGCHCQDPSSEGHGPYWYARDLETGQRTYLGKALPPHVRHALTQLDTRENQLLAARNHLHEQYIALCKLYRRHDPLTPRDRQHIVDLGFNDCLVTDVDEA